MVIIIINTTTTTTTTATILTTLFRCRVLFSWPKAYWLLIKDTIYHSKMDGDLLHDRQTTLNRYVSEGLRFNVLIREDAKV